MLKTHRSIVAECDGQPPCLPTQLSNNMWQNWDVDIKIGIWSAMVGVNTFSFHVYKMYVPNWVRNCLEVTDISCILSIRYLYMGIGLVILCE
jgi:hypothetical protein